MTNIVSPKFSPADFSEGQSHEMLVTLGKFGFSPKMADQVANPKSGMATKIVALFVAAMDVTSDLKEQLGWWTALWAEFGFTVDPTSITLPTVPAGFGPVRLGVIPQGLTIQKAWEIAESLFPCKNWIDGDLDKAIPTNDRKTDKAYAVAFRDRPEADEEFKNLSANDLKARNHKGITALETIVDEVGFYKKTGGHRDIQNVTLCSGSRSSDGFVPRSRWYDDVFLLYWLLAGYRDDNLRSRQAVS